MQELSVYVVRPDGTDLKRVTSPGVCSGSPKWSADSRQLVFYEMPVETTWDARVFGLSAAATSQIVSIDLERGVRTERSSGPGLKLMPQFLPDGRIGYLTKAGREEGIGYTQGAGTFPGSLRSPAWSTDGSKVVYEKVDYTPRPQNQLLYSWDPKYEYRYTDVFPTFSRQGKLLITAKDVDSSVVSLDADGGNRRVIFRATTPCASVPSKATCSASEGVAFQPGWSADGVRDREPGEARRPDRRVGRQPRARALSRERGSHRGERLVWFVPDARRSFDAPGQVRGTRDDRAKSAERS